MFHIPMFQALCVASPPPPPPASNYPVLIRIGYYIHFMDKETAAHTGYIGAEVGQRVET